MILKYNVPKPSEVCMSEEQLQRFFDFIMCDDLDFYEKYTIHLTKEEQERFFRDNPDFMSDVRGECEMDLVKERIYREIMKKINSL